MPRLVVRLFIVVLVLAAILVGYYIYLQSVPQIKVVNNLKEASIDIDSKILRKLWKETYFLKDGKLVLDLDTEKEFKPNYIFVEFKYGTPEDQMIWRVLFGDKLSHGFNAERIADNYHLTIFFGQDWLEGSPGPEGDSQTINSVLAQSALYIGRLYLINRKITEVGEVGKLFEDIEKIVKKYPIANVKRI